MNEKRSSWLYGSLAGLLVFGVVFGTAYFFYSQYLKSNVKKEVDETKLFIGCPYQNDSQYVDLILRAKGPSGIYSKTVNSKDLVKLDGQDEATRFYDYAAEPLIGTEGKSIGAWLADSDNSIKVQTVADSLIVSSEVSINASGVWLVNVAPKDGATPAINHSSIYTNWVLGSEDNK